MTIHNDIHFVNETSVYQIFGITPKIILASFFIFLLILYIGAVYLTNRRYKSWPLYRSICWSLGILFALVSFVGPIANQAHIDFTAHMLCHLLLGMLAPLFMVLAAPLTLILRTLSTPLARSLSSILRSWPLHVMTHPIVTTFLNIGGLWLLYTSNVYGLMHEIPLIYLTVHIHLLLAGYLFTISIIYIDPIFHRKSFPFRAVILIIALAGHGILSKYIYAHPPEGVPLKQAELGSMMMYYGGDIIDGTIIFLLCWQWFRSTKMRAYDGQAS